MTGAKNTVILAIALLAVACASSPEIQYYSLVNFTNRPVSGTCMEGETGIAQVHVQPFAVSPPFDTVHIVYQPPDSPQSIGFYESHRWAGPPGWMIAQTVTDQLCRHGVNAVPPDLTSDMTSRRAVTLTATVTEFLEVDLPSGPTGQIALVLRAKDPQGRLIFEHSLSGQVPAKARTVESVVGAMRQALRQALTRAPLEQLL